MQKADGGWSAATPFPFIQGTDCCGRVVAVGAGVDAARIGERVLVRAVHASRRLRLDGKHLDGVRLRRRVRAIRQGAGRARPSPSTAAGAMSSSASIPCAYGTAENMLHRAQVVRGEQVLIAGASGGVGSAAVQLAKRRGAIVTAIAARVEGGPGAVVRRRPCPRSRRRCRRGVGRKIRRRRRRQRRRPGIRQPAEGAPARRALRLVGRDRRPAGHARHAHVLSAGPDADRLHGLGRAGVPEPDRLHRARRDPSAGRKDLPARAHRRCAARVPREKATPASSCWCPRTSPTRPAA